MYTYFDTVRQAKANFICSLVQQSNHLTDT